MNTDLTIFAGILIAWGILGWYKWEAFARFHARNYFWREAKPEEFRASIKGLSIISLSVGILILLVQLVRAIAICFAN